MNQSTVDRIYSPGSGAFYPYLLLNSKQVHKASPQTAPHPHRQISFCPSPLFKPIPPSADAKGGPKNHKILSSNPIKIFPRGSKRLRLSVRGPFGLHENEGGDDQEQDAAAQSQEYPS